MPVDFHGIVNLAVCQSSVTWQASHIQSAQRRHSSMLPVVVICASACVLILCLAQDLAAFVSGMRNVWLVVMVMLTVSSECS